MAGRQSSSADSRDERLFLSIQFRSLDVYFSFGTISFRSAPAIFARAFAFSAVVPDAEKYATTFFMMTSCLSPLTYYYYDSKDPKPLSRAAS